MATITRTNGGARPADGSSFGNAQITGRQLTHYTVYSAGMFAAAGDANAVKTNYLAAGSDYEKLVLAIEQVGSIELLGVPQSGNLFHVALSGAAPAANASSSYYTTKSSGSLEAYCNTSISGSGVSGATVQLGVGISASATQVLY